MKEKYWLITYKKSVDVSRGNYGDPMKFKMKTFTETFKNENWTDFCRYEKVEIILFLKEITQEEYDNSKF